MIGEILSLIPSIVGLFSSNSSHDEYSSDLEKIRAQQKLSNSALQAKSLYAENATRGLAGYETMKQDINNQLPTTLNESKDWLSGGGAVDFLARASANTNQQLRNLNNQNEQQKQNNQEMYAQYLGGTMASREDMLLQNQSQLDVAAGYNNVDKSATQNKIMGGVGNMLAGIADKDLASIIAGLSKSAPKLDATTAQDYGIPGGQYSQSPVDRMQPIGINPYDVGQSSPRSTMPQWLIDMITNQGIR